MNFFHKEFKSKKGWHGGARVSVFFFTNNPNVKKTNNFLVFFGRGESGGG